jgi:hypothetical protein
MSDSVVIVAPPGVLNSNAAMAAYSSGPQNELTAGSLLVTVSSVQHTLATWLGTLGTGTVTSVSGDGDSTGMTLAGGPITTSGTLTLGGTLVAAHGGTGATALGATSLAVSGGTLVARTGARMQLQWVTGAVVTNDTVYFAYDPPYPGTINSLTSFAGVGSFTLAVNIAGSPVTGLSAVTVNSPTPATTNASAANTFTAGQIIAGVITGAASSPTDVLLSLNVTWGA